MNRRSIINILVGAIAALSGLGVMSYLRQGRCTGAGGEWSSATRSCTSPSGPIVVEQSMDVVIAVVAAIVVGWILFRISTFATRQKSGPAA